MMDNTMLILMLLWMILAHLAYQPIRGIAWFSAVFCAFCALDEISWKIKYILS